jgi:hypothetical protein
VRNGSHAERHSRGALPWLAAGALVVLAVFGIPFAVLLTGNATPPGPAHHHKPQALAAASSPTNTGPTLSASPSPSASTRHPANKGSHSASPGPAASHTSRPSVTAPQPTNSSPTPAPTVQLAATISASGWPDSQGGGRVSFQVDDNGSAATGQLSVTITLPAGASMTGGPGGGGGGGGGDAQLRPFYANGGWNCQATSAGATCTHAGIAAGSQASGAIYFTLSGGTACGQPVELRAASGSASASARATVSC